jgi:sugar-specific transcriptional regulator TrmB
VEEREVAALRRIGLTEYESRIYLVLVRMGPTKASEVSFFGQVPRTKTYGAIKELERKGLLKVLPGKPEVYAAASPSEVLMPLVNRLNRDVKDTENVVQELNLAFESSRYVKRDTPRESSEFWQIEGRQNIFNKLGQILNDATKVIHYSTTAAGLIRIYKAHTEIFERVKARGVSVKVLSPISSENSGVAKQLSEMIELRIVERPIGPIFASVDTRELVVMEAKPDDLRIDRGSDFAIWTTNHLLVELHEHLFDRVWATLPGFEFPREKGER